MRSFILSLVIFIVFGGTQQTSYDAREVSRSVRDRAAAEPVPVRVTLEFYPPPGIYEESFFMHIIPHGNMPDDAGIQYIIVQGDAPFILRENLYEHNGGAVINTDIARTFGRPLYMHDRSDDENFLAAIEADRIGCFFVYTREYYVPPAEPVDKGIVIIAQAFCAQGRPISDIYTGSFFVGPFARYNLPIISLTMNYDYLFCDTIGIYVRGHDNTGGYMPPSPVPVPRPNWEGREREWERPGFFEMFEPGADGHDRILSQNVGVRIHGGGSRRMAQKSLRIYARDDWDPNNFRIRNDIFGGMARNVLGEVISAFDRLVLRQGGNEGVNTMIRDVAQQYLSRYLNLGVQASRAVVLFINGEFWGIYHIRERFDDRYIAAHYNVDRDNVVLLELSGGLGLVVSSGTPQDRLDLLALDALTNDPLVHPDDRYRAVQRYIYIDSFIDHFVAKIFFGDIDWPHNNWRVWRYGGEHDPQNPMTDGRWRWLLPDMDSSSGAFYSLAADHDSIGRLLYPTTVLQRETAMFRGLWESEMFRRRFYFRFVHVVETYFHEEAYLAAITHFTEELRDAMPYQIARWGRLDSIPAWDAYIGVLEDFARRRHGYILEYLRYHVGPEAMGPPPPQPPEPPPLTITELQEQMRLAMLEMARLTIEDCQSMEMLYNAIRNLQR